MAALKGVEFKALIAEILRCTTARLAADAARAAAAAA
jgi:hypothetical protein